MSNMMLTTLGDGSFFFFLIWVYGVSLSSWGKIHHDYINLGFSPGGGGVILCILL